MHFSITENLWPNALYFMNKDMFLMKIYAYVRYVQISDYCNTFASDVTIPIDL